MEEKPSVHQLITDAAKQYVEETKSDMPSLSKSDVAAVNNTTDVVILRDNEGEILAHYQHLKGTIFQRLDNKDRS